MRYPHWSAAKHCLKLSNDLNVSFILYVGKVSQVTHSLWDLIHSNKVAWPYSSLCRSSVPVNLPTTPTAVLYCILPNILQAPGKGNILMYLQPRPQVFLYKCWKQLVAPALFPSRRRLLTFFATLNCAKEAGTVFPEAGIEEVGAFHLQRAFWVVVVR